MRNILLIIQKIPTGGFSVEEVSQNWMSNPAERIRQVADYSIDGKEVSIHIIDTIDKTLHTDERARELAIKWYRRKYPNE